MRIMLLMIPLVASAGFHKTPVVDKAPFKKKAVIDAHLEKILAQEKAIAKLLARPKGPKRKTPVDKITALSRFKGILLNSVVATDVRPSKFIVRLKGGKRKGAELRCLGYEFRRRVLARCDLLVIEGVDYRVDVEIWDMDGAEGIIADRHYTGEEREFLAMSLASFWGGIVGSAKEAIPSRNRFLKGIAKIGDHGKDKIEESARGRIAVSLVNSGREVIAFFNKSVFLTKGRK